ncbi:hypothetical protein B1R27_09405 [Streptomyces sp. GKU 895]|nr:hypothetical protein B1R27_09405 [Streptomyces sp. GKU 895]
MRLAREGYTQRFYYLLGPLRVETPDRRQPITVDELPMLAMLLLRHGRKVTTDELAAGLWGSGERPDSPLEELAGLARRLNSALEPGALAALPGGYALHTSADYVDLIECERLVAQTPRERAHYDQALALWRSGTPLANVLGPAARTARTRLTQLRLGLYRSRAELDLELGEFERAATELESLLALYPAREDFRRLYLIALRRQGRTEEALEVYEEYELSGGDNPELMALGRELREEFGGGSEETADEEDPEAPTDTDTAYGFVAAPDEHPDGFVDPEGDRPTILDLRPELPEGTPLPLDDVPESLFAGEDTGDEDGPEIDTHDRIRYAFADGRQPGAARDALRRLVHELLDAGEVPLENYRLLDTDDGIAVLMNAYVDGSALLRATLDLLPDRMRRLGGLRVRVEFSKVGLQPDGSEVYSDLPGRELTQAALNASSAQAVIALSDSWHDTEIADAPLGTYAPFRPLVPRPGWYCLVHQSLPADDDTPTGPDEPAVRGPFPMPYDGTVPRSRGEATAIVLALPDGEFALPESPTLRTTPASLRAGWSYYEVDLRPRELVLDAVRPGVTVRWSVDDPVLAAGSPLDPRRVIADTVTDASLTGRAAEAALRPLRVPGYTLRWSFPATPPRRRSPEDLIANAAGVLLGFDGVLAHLYPSGSEQSVLLDLERLAMEGGDPEGALPGRPSPTVAEHSDSLGLLRAFAHHDLAQPLRRRADLHDMQAADTARPVQSAAELLRTLHASGTRTAVVTDRATTAATRYLARLDLPVRGGVHGRGTDLTRLMPHPHVLTEALDVLGAPASACVLVGSTVAGLRAARAISLPFIGFSGYETVRRELRGADPDVPVVWGLAALVAAARRR